MKRSLVQISPFFEETYAQDADLPRLLTEQPSSSSRYVLDQHQSPAADPTAHPPWEIFASAKLQAHGVYARPGVSAELPRGKPVLVCS